jgi:molybdopterin-guanine dinucleotide biosynthesis protein A
VSRLEGVAGLVLAGGQNRRMAGRDKCRIEVRGRPVIAQILELLDRLFAEVIVVANQPAAVPRIDARIRVTRDRYPGCGPLAGLQAGLETCSLEAAFCVACDMPYLDEALIRRQAALFRKLRKEEPAAAVLLPRTGALIEPLHGIYHREVEPVIRELLEDGRGYSIRRLFERVPTRFLDLPDTPEERRRFVNINTPQDVDRARSEEGAAERS